MSTPIALYHQVASLLRQQIADGVYHEGDRLPPEKELARELGVSRATVRQALADLAEAGLIRRRHGHGTFVLAPPEPRGQRFHGSLQELLGETGRAGVTHVAIEREVQLPAPIAAQLGMAREAPGTVVRRVRTIDGQPFAYTINYLPSKFGELLDEDGLRDRGLMQLLEDRGVRIESASQAIAAERADLATSEGLEIDLGAPVLAVERVLDGPSGPIQLVRSWYRSDRYVYSVTFDRRGQSASDNLDRLA